jgi:Xaa-Pro aminopeptidase
METGCGQVSCGKCSEWLMAIDKERRDEVLQAIEGSDLQALACFSASEVLLLTGYWPVMGWSFAIVTRDGQACAIVPEDELELAQSTSDVEFIPYRPARLDRLTEPAGSLKDSIRRLYLRLQFSSGRIGVSLGQGAEAASYPSGNLFRTSIIDLLQQENSGIAVVAGDAIFDSLKSIKTSTEIDLIRHACRLAAAGFDEATRSIAEGRREDEIAADVGAAFARVANRDFERSRGYFFCMSGPNSYKASAAYARTRSRVVQDGDLVMIHANTVGDGYWTDISRTYIVGKTSAEHQRMRNAILEARGAAMDAISPGVPASRVDAAARDVLAGYGFGSAFKHATGHGVGFAAADPNALPRIHPHSPDVLKPGMAFNIEPAIYLEGIGGMRHCDVVACTTAGREVLTDF